MKLRLTLHSQLYSLIYDALKDKFTEREWPANGGRPGGKYGIWEKENSDGVSVVEKLFQVSFKFFYDRNVKASKGHPITIYTDTLEKVFDYIGCSGTDIVQQIESFYRVYTVSPAVITAQDKQSQEMDDEKKNSKKGAKNTSVITTHQNISAENINNFHFNIQADAIAPQDAVTEIVYAFYAQIATGSKSGFESAWSMLSESFQNRIWVKRANELKALGIEKEPLDHFKDGYYFFRSLHDTHVFNMKLSGPVANCMVYYEEELELPHIEELADINKTAIKHVRGLAEKIDAFTKVIEEFGGKGFADKALIRLFYPTPTETIWFEHGLNHEALKLKFPATTTSTVHRLLKCRCVRESDSWLIDGLVPLHCRQL